jgi:hypothetical protein
METTPPNPKKFSSPWYSKAGLLYFVAAGRDQDWRDAGDQHENTSQGDSERKP